MADPSGFFAQQDPSALMANDDGGLHAAAPKPPSGIKKTPGIISRAGAEFFAAVGFVSMFAAIGGLIPALAAGAVTAGVITTMTLGFAIGITSMLASASIKKRMEDRNAQSEEHPQKAHNVVIQNLQLQPHIEVKHKKFARMIEAERAQAQDHSITRN